jgi:hypothetical protein
MNDGHTLADNTSEYKRVRLLDQADVNSEQFRFTLLYGFCCLYISELMVSISYVLLSESYGELDKQTGRKW